MSNRNTVLSCILLLVAVVLEVSVLPVHLLSAFKPDLLLLFMVFMALRFSFESGAPLAWLLGLIKDVFSGLFLGMNAFAFLIIFLVIKSVSDRLYADSPGLFVLTSIAATLACSAITLLLVLMFTTTSGLIYSMSVDLIPHLLINSFIASLAPFFPGFIRYQEPT